MAGYLHIYPFFFLSSTNILVLYMNFLVYNLHIVFLPEYQTKRKAWSFKGNLFSHLATIHHLSLGPSESCCKEKGGCSVFSLAFWLSFILLATLQGTNYTKNKQDIYLGFSLFDCCCSFSSIGDFKQKTPHGFAYKQDFGNILGVIVFTGAE